MATKTSLHVSFLLWLLVFYPDCRLQGVQASATSKTLDKGVTTISTAAKCRPAGVPIAEPQALIYTGTFPAVNASSNITLGVTYPDDWDIQTMVSTTWWIPTPGKFYPSISGDNNLDVKWEVPPLVSAEYIINVTILQVNRKIIC
jgi:hypothetical protein